LQLIVLIGELSYFSGDDFMTHSIKTKLAAAMLLTFPCFSAVATVEGTLETTNCDVIKGWAWDNANPATRVQLDIYDVKTLRKIKLATVTANLLRNNLMIGDKKYGFSYILPASVRDAVKHKLSVRINGTATELTSSPKITATACYGKLNDTGIQTCSNATTNGLACPATGFAGQDGDYGRDALAKAGKLAKIGKGRAGFDFTKIANDGSVLPANAVLGLGAKDWACTRDNVTGLIWEVKTDNGDGGLRAKDNSYTWYNTDNATNGGFAGEKNLMPDANTSSCGFHTIDSCNTQSYAQAVNATKLCGKSNWRMPTPNELRSIVDYSRYNPAIDPNYFPNTENYGYSMYWSSVPSNNDSNTAEVIDFIDGSNEITYYKSSGAYVRLVTK
jgi:Protein of unknown function (DUF1566)